jgi:hypothetical protein
MNGFSHELRERIDVLFQRAASQAVGGPVRSPRTNPRNESSRQQIPKTFERRPMEDSWHCAVQANPSPSRSVLIPLTGSTERFAKNIVFAADDHAVQHAESTAPLATYEFDLLAEISHLCLNQQY